MSRFFFTEKEADLFSDITKELIKDVVGQKIYYYRVREDLSNVHALYEESMEKVFDPPIELECMVEWQPAEVKTTNFGTEYYRSITCYLHPRDLLDRNISVNEGDFFSFGSFFFEATSVIPEKIVFGQVERVMSYKMTGKQARVNLINKKPLGPTSEMYTDPNAVQKTFEQQRGFETDLAGNPTGDMRKLRKDGVLEEPITGAKTVKKATATAISSFYDEDGH